MDQLATEQVITIRMPRTLHKQLRDYCHANHTSMNKVVLEMIRIRTRVAPYEAEPMDRGTPEGEWQVINSRNKHIHENHLSKDVAIAEANRLNA